jgi:2-polyprenyl-3-methyl-5-hydroxy-6-metoxy-1,4-benzoquinol methylase
MTAGQGPTRSASPRQLDPEGLELARAWLNNVRNRGIYERPRFVSLRAGLTPADQAATLAFVLDGRFEALAGEDLEPVTRLLEPDLHAPPARILDAGCGPGATTLALAARHSPAEVVGVDVEGPAIDLARHLARDHPECSFRLGALEDLADPQGFDLIHCREVLEHVHDPRRSLHNLLSLLRPGGIAYVETPNYRYPWEPHVRLPILPHSPKWLLVAECRLAGRDPGFVDHLNLECSRARLLRWARESGQPVRVVDLMARKVDSILAGEPGVEPVVPRRRRAVVLIRRLGLVRPARRVLIDLGAAPSVMLLFAKVAQPRPAALEATSSE